MTKKLMFVAVLLAAVSFVSKAEAGIVTSTATATTPSTAMIAKPAAGYLYLKGCSFSSTSGNCVQLRDLTATGTVKFQICAASSVTVMGAGNPANVAGGSQTGNIASALGESLVFTGPVYVTANTGQTGDLLVCSFGTKNL